MLIVHHHTDCDYEGVQSDFIGVFDNYESLEKGVLEDYNKKAKLNNEIYKNHHNSYRMKEFDKTEFRNNEWHYQDSWHWYEILEVELNKVV